MKINNKQAWLNLLNSLKLTYLNGNITVIEAVKDQEWLNYTFDQPFLLISRITDNYVDIESKGETYRAHPGHVVIIPPHMKYKIHLKGSQFTTYWLNINVRLFEHIDLFSSIATPCVSTASVGDAFAKLHSEITSMICSDPASTPITIQSLIALQQHIYHLMDMIISMTQLNISQFMDFSQIQRFHSVLTYIDDHLDEKIKVDRLAELMFLSTSHFYKEFRDTFRMSPMQYIAEQRLKKAQHLLATTDLTVGEVGQRVGYDQAYPFIRFFKSMYGSNPSEYKKLASKQLHRI